jgi:ribosomal protein L37E
MGLEIILQTNWVGFAFFIIMMIVFGGTLVLSFATDMAFYQSFGVRSESNPPPEMKTNCSSCGARVSIEKENCDHCGQPMTEKS